MSNKMICPVCKKPLEQVGTSRQYQCGSWGCDLSFDMIGTEALWQALNESHQATLTNAQTLLEIHKDLEIAVDALKRIKEPTAWGSLYQEQEIATDALEEIGKHNE